MTERVSHCSIELLFLTNDNERPSPSPLHPELLVSVRDGCGELWLICERERCVFHAVLAREAQGQGCCFCGAALTDVFADSAKRDVAGAYDEE